MDQALVALLSWQFLLFSLGIFFIVWMLRTVLEFFWPKLVDNKVWEELILRLSPSLLGMIVGYIATGFPFPLGINESSGRIIFGLVAGSVSSLIYASIKGMVKGYIQGIANGIVNVNQNAGSGGDIGAPNVPSIAINKGQ